MVKKIAVGSGEIAVVNDASQLEVIGLGSCVAVCLFDRVHKIAGMAHVMLGHPPENKIINVNPLRYTDCAIDRTIERMEKLGSKKYFMKAKIFGGASMFATSMFNIGEENVKAVKEKLEKEMIKVIAEDVGGNNGRNIWFDTENGSVVVSSVFKPTKEY